MQKEPLKTLQTDIGYSVRRYYVDSFYSNEIKRFPTGSRILDMGGKKLDKRGCFDIGHYDLQVEYANLSEETEPDYLCDIASVPVPDASFDGVILAEVLEHIAEPLAVLQEIHRVLKPGGIALICTPFLFHIHADPVDFARYTDHWYRVNLGALGLEPIEIQKQGAYFSMLAHLVKLGVYELLKAGRPARKWKRKILHKLFFRFQDKALAWDTRDGVIKNWALSGNTTGFGVVALKK